MAGYTGFGVLKPLIFVSIFYVIWNARNGNSFDKSSDVALVVRMWEMMVEGFAGEGHEINQKPRPLLTADGWKPLMEGCLGVHVDVAINLNFAAAVMVAFDNTGTITFIGSATFDSMALEMAKTKALLLAFKQAAKEDWLRVDWHSDA